MSKRSRKFFDSLSQHEMLDSPQQKRRRLNEEARGQTLSRSPSPILSRGISSETRTRIVSNVMRNLSLRPPSPNSPKNRRRIRKSPAVVDSIDTTRNTLQLGKVFAGQTFAIPEITVEYRDLDKQRRRLLLRLIAHHDGRVLTMSDLAKSDTTAAAVIVSEHIQKHVLDRALERAGVIQHDKIAFVIPDFVTSSLKFGRKMNCECFKPRCLRQRQKVEETAGLAPS